MLKTSFVPKKKEKFEPIPLFIEDYYLPPLPPPPVEEKEEESVIIIDIF